MRKQIKETKVFKPFPTRNIRISDKVWETFKSNKLKSGESWDRFINKINNNEI